MGTSLCRWTPWRLRTSLRQAGIPIKLRQVIEGLWQTFFTIITDAYRVDLVLDLYDVFATFHRMLTTILPNRFNEAGRSSRLLDEDQVQQISGLVAAVENALRHRVAKAASLAPSEDMAVDIRGGMQQFLLAASAPLICSIGLCRRYFLGSQEETYKSQAWNRFTGAGVVTQVNLGPGLRCVPVDLGMEQMGQPQLAYYDVDVSHVLPLASYADYFHEAGHLVFRNAFRADAPRGFESDELARLWDLRDAPNPDCRHEFIVTQDRLSEIFAIFFEQVFIYGGNRDAGLLHRVASFSRSLASVGQGRSAVEADTDATVRFVEAVLQPAPGVLASAGEGVISRATAGMARTGPAREADRSRLEGLHGDAQAGSPLLPKRREPLER